MTKEILRMDPHAVAKQVRFDPSFHEDYGDPNKRTFFCRFCGFQLYFYGYRNNRQECIWACSTKGCPNNLDYQLKFQLNGDVLNNLGNTERAFLPFEVRHVA